MHVVFVDFHCFLRKVTGLERNWIVMTHSIAKLSCLLPQYKLLHCSHGPTCLCALGIDY